MIEAIKKIVSNMLENSKLSKEFKSYNIYRRD